MKRQTKIKTNNGPVNPRNRKEKREKAQAFIDECEKSLIHLIDQSSKTAMSWLELEKELRNRFNLLRKTYPNHKAKISVAVFNIERALKKLKEEI